MGTAAVAYEDNTTNVGVYVNHVSSCNLNHNTGNMLCINRDYESVTQYHNVRQTVFCPYHYCVLFDMERKKVSCTGYVYLKISGSMEKYFNPLTPKASLESFTGNPNEEYVTIGTSFLGYNVIIDRFEQSVETTVGDENIDSVRCMDPYSTCIEFEDGSEKCFGAIGEKFHNLLHSSLLGLSVTGALAFSVYFIAGVTYKGCLLNPCFSVITIPMLVSLCSVLILFVASDFIVKTLPFIISSMIGIACGFLTAKSLLGCIDIFKRPSTASVDIGSTETVQLQGYVTDDDDEGEDAGMTEIELGTIKVA